MDRSSKAAVVFLALFSLPFCAFGVLAVSKGVRQIMDGSSGQAWMLVPFGLVFIAIGFGLLGAAVFGPRNLKQAQRLKTENPEQPWLWRADWAQGRANSETKPEMTRAWVFSILWNAISLPIIFVLPKEKLQEQPASLIALAFPLIGMALLVWAVRETLRWFEFGKTYFEMSAVPCALGREIKGTIQTRFPRPPVHGIQLKLTCINRIVTNSGSTASSQEKILWREEKTVAPEDLYPGPIGTGIPVSFHIPGDARPTDGTNSRNCVFWKLEADADVPGVDYQDRFEVPVFRTKDTPADDPEEAEMRAPSQAPANPTIRVRPASEGGTEFYFPAARNKSFAGSLTGFVLLWSGLLWLMIAKGAPFIFPLMFGLFELLLIYGALQLWLGTSRVVIGNGAVRVQGGMLGGGKMQQIAFTDVAGIRTAITSQQGGGSAGTPYYDLDLIRTDGMKVTLGRTVRDKHEAEYLAAEMQRLIVPKPQTASASAGR